MNLTIRNATLADAGRIAEIETAAWPPGLETSEDKIAERIRVFPGGQWVAERDGQVIAIAFSQRITQQFLDVTQKTFSALTDQGRLRGSHTPGGEITQLLSVAVDPAGQGLGIARKLVDHEIAAARQLPGITRILGFTRPAAFSRHAEISIDDYVHARKSSGKPVDPLLAFHVIGGARIVSIHAGFRPSDEQSRGYGVLIEYPLHV